MFMEVGVVADRNSGGAFTFPNLVRATLERLPRAPEAADRETTDPDATGSGVVVELDGGCASGAPAGPDDQGNTPSDR